MQKRLKDATCKEIDATLSHWAVPRIPESMLIKLKMPEAEFNAVDTSTGTMTPLKFLEQWKEMRGKEACVINHLNEYTD